MIERKGKEGEEINKAFWQCRGGCVNVCEGRVGLQVFDVQSHCATDRDTMEVRSDLVVGSELALVGIVFGELFPGLHAMVAIVLGAKGGLFLTSVLLVDLVGVGGVCKGEEKEEASAPVLAVLAAWLAYVEGSGGVRSGGVGGRGVGSEVVDPRRRCGACGVVQVRSLC